MKQPDPTRLYTPRFFLASVSLTCFMIAYTMLLHLSRYVVEAGGSVVTVGWVFGIGMTGSLLCRPFIGQWIDRTGVRTVMVASCLLCGSVVITFGLTQHLVVLTGLRVLIQLGQAAYLAAFAVAAARIAPEGRRAESLAMLGTGGLLGIMVGPPLGELVLARASSGFSALFTGDAVFLLLAAATAYVLPLEHPVNPPGHQPLPLIAAARRHWPGWVLWGGILLAFTQCVPVLFIERFVAHRGIPSVAVFFAVYSPTAVILRITTRRVAAQAPRQKVFTFGLLLYVVGILAMIPASSNLHLVPAALLMGAGHCFSYPYLIDLTSSQMPEHHRGLSTSLALAAIDVGFLIAFSTGGLAISVLGFAPSLFALACIVLVGTLIWNQRQVT